ncbi:calcium:proton antiporter [Rhizobium sp. RM]|uniref:calcium:proton antiporter n=1 Tax=Rhizobium sp. RM TaxID=2748079 RepID=UPI00110E8D77|nr:calcium:proton antiporter [Rhizobium sp. RM]NWJ26079.1 calcium:proton antiporter [Rhizobium sp. RM]TMV20679.1 calcium:proton antiporter [Rhizobium sp. Td3]
MPHMPAISLFRGVVPKLVIAWAVVAAFQFEFHSWLSADMSPMVAIGCFAVLFATILMAAFGVVREADALAHRLGEPYGTLILTLSIVSIEVILIAAVMLGPGEAPTIARDSIFAVMMIIMNLITGICLLAGALKYGEQEYNAPGTITFISMILILVGVALLLPNTLSTGNGTFTPVQAVVLSVLTVIGYGGFLALQMGRYRSDFMQPEAGRMWILLSEAASRNKADDTKAQASGSSNLMHAVRLVALMLPIVLLAHDLAIIIDNGVVQAGAPVAVGGVLIAIIVFTPESITAIKAALNNETQRAINLCLGAFVSTVGLTVPAVLTVGLMTGKTVVFGISAVETVLLALTIGLTTLTYLGHRTSATQGMLHILLFFVFGLMLFTA